MYIYIYIYGFLKRPLLSAIYIHIYLYIYTWVCLKHNSAHEEQLKHTLMGNQFKSSNLEGARFSDTPI